MLSSTVLTRTPPRGIHMKLNRLLAAMSAAGLMALVGPAQASITFQFNPLGNGAGAGVINDAGILDQAPGNTIALDVHLGGAIIPVGTVIKDLYQANLSAVQDLFTANLFSNGTNGGSGLNKFFTFVASFTETVVTAAVTPLGGGVFKLENGFSINGGGTFKMCKQLALGSNLTGVGFGCGDADTILKGRIDGGDTSQTTTLKFTPAGALITSTLDQAGVNDWPGYQSVSSIGISDIIATVDFVNAMYFPDLQIGRKISANASLVTPYKVVDPSRSFSSGLVTNDTLTDINACAVCAFGVNGVTGKDFIFASDANSSFDAPEPGSLALGGFALVGLAVLRARRKQSV